MKIKTGFISNSSSTSFIVAFPKYIRKADELKEYFDLGKDDREYIFRQIQNQRGISARKIKNIVDRVYKLAEEIRKETKGNDNLVEFMEELLGYEFVNIGIDFYKHYDDILTLANKNPDSIIYSFGFENSNLENPETFEKLPHLWRSHH